MLGDGYHRLVSGRRSHASNDREDLCRMLDAVAGRLLSGFPLDSRRTDNQGGVITKEHVERYLRRHRALHADAVQAVRTWAPGRRVGEIGPAYGAQLLCLRTVYDYQVHAFELPENIPIYCGGLQTAGIRVDGWDLYESAPQHARRDFDLLICSEVVEHLYVALPVLVENMRPALRVGGRLLLSTPNLYRLSNISRIFSGNNICEAHPSIGHKRAGLVTDAREHPREYTCKEIENAFARSHWRLLRLWTAGEETLTGRWRSRIRARLLRWTLPYPVGKTIFVVAERTR